jgi:hypothetical protein
MGEDLPEIANWRWSVQRFGADQKENLTAKDAKDAKHRICILLCVLSVPCGPKRPRNDIAYTAPVTDSVVVAPLKSVTTRHEHLIGES